MVNPAAPKRFKRKKANVTLSGLLNVLDGVGSEEGKLFFATVSFRYLASWKRKKIEHPCRPIMSTVSTLRFFVPEELTPRLNIILPRGSKLPHSSSASFPGPALVPMSVPRAARARKRRPYHCLSLRTSQPPLLPTSRHESSPPQSCRASCCCARTNRSWRARISWPG